MSIKTAGRTATAAGESVNAYIMEAVAERMARGKVDNSKG